MKTVCRFVSIAGALALAATIASTQSKNDLTLNNGGDFYTTFSDPSAGAPTGTNPPDITGDLYWRSHAGSEFMNDFDVSLGAAMEITGYLETIVDQDWTTSPSFLDRSHGPAVVGASGALEPAFFTLGLTTEVLVSLGPTGFGSPCTIYPSLCTPSGGCAPGGGLVWTADITVTPGVIMPADGTSASDMATTYFHQGGWTATGGGCGIGTYETNALLSTDESVGDVTGLGINVSGGFQIAGSGPIAWGVATATEANIQFSGNILNMIADTGFGLGVESADNGGGAMNGRFLSVGSGLATLGCELRDESGAGSPNIAIVGSSSVPLANPGVPAFGGNLLIQPTKLFTETSTAWTGRVVPSMPWFTTEGIFTGEQLPVPAASVGSTVYTQGATISLITFTADTTNAVSTRLLP